MGGGKERGASWSRSRARRLLSPAGLQLPGYLSGKLSSRPPETGGEPPTFLISLAPPPPSPSSPPRRFARPDVSSAVLARTEIQDFRPARETSRRHRGLRRKTGRIRRRSFSFSSPSFLDFLPTRRQVRRNKREKCSTRILVDNGTCVNLLKRDVSFFNGDKVRNKAFWPTCARNVHETLFNTILILGRK